MDEADNELADELFSHVLGPDYWVPDAGISRRTWEILLLRKGCLDGRFWSLAECANRYGVSRERIRQIETNGVKALLATVAPVTGASVQMDMAIPVREAEALEVDERKAPAPRMPVGISCSPLSRPKRARVMAPIHHHASIFRLFGASGTTGVPPAAESAGSTGVPPVVAVPPPPSASTTFARLRAQVLAQFGFAV